MIDTLYIANYLQELLNLNSQGIKFLIFADEGDLRNSVKIGNKVKTYTHGLVEIISSNIIPIKNISFSSFSTQLMILVDINKTGFIEFGELKRKQSRNVLAVKDCIAELIERINGQTTEIVDEGKTYSATIGMSQPTDGQKMPFGEMEDCLPLYINISFSLFENGVNANDCKIIVNGEDLYFTRLVVSNVKTADQNEFAGNVGGKTAVLVGGKSIDLTMPCVKSKFGTLIMEDILGHKKLNTPLAVTLETPLYTENYIGILGTNSVSMDVGSNAGYNISIVEGVPGLLEYGEGWQTRTYSNDIAQIFLEKGTYIIWWGDGTSNKIVKTEYGEEKHTYTDGKNIHDIVIYKEA